MTERGHSGSSNLSDTPEQAPTEYKVVAVPMTWVEPLPPIEMVNATHVVVDDVGDIIVTLGQFTPPALPPDDVERARIISELKELSATPLIRFTASTERLRAMIMAFEAIVKTQEAYRAAIEESRKGSDV
jgi:hypothetical protein